jgi:hypothetical protein
MLPEVWLAQLEHREWERRFNKRAARGEFVQHADRDFGGVLETRPRVRLGRLGDLIRSTLSAARLAAGQLS